MRKTLPIAALAAFLSVAALPALASDAYTTANVNLRAGPGTNYPRIGVIATGTLVDIQGCISNWRWCDVRVQGDRGWVTGASLSMMRGNNRVYLRDEAPTLGLPILSFMFDDYWDNNYRTHTFYRDRDRYRNNWRARDWDRDRDWNRDRDRDLRREQWDREHPRPGLIDNRKPGAPPLVETRPVVVPPPVVSAPPVVVPDRPEIPRPFVDHRALPPSGPSSMPITPDGKIDNRRPGVSK